MDNDLPYFFMKGLEEIPIGNFFQENWKKGPG